MLEITWLLALLKNLGHEENLDSELAACERTFYAHAGRKPNTSQSFIQQLIEVNQQMQEEETYPETMAFVVTRHCRKKQVGRRVNCGCLPKDHIVRRGPPVPGADDKNLTKVYEADLGVYEPLVFSAPAEESE